MTTDALDAYRKLLEITARLNSESEPERLLEEILDRIIDLLQAERGFLLLVDAEGLAVRVARGFDKRDLDADEHSLSRTIIEQVRTSGEPLVTVDAQRDERVIYQGSIRRMALRAIAALPLRIESEVVGVVYLDSTRPSDSFSESVLPLLNAFGDQAGIALRNARMMGELKRAEAQLRRENRYLKREIAEERGFQGIVGSSAPLQSVLAMVKQVASVSSVVLLLGESGTGKELVARAVHQLSRRRDKAMIKLNCAALSESLLESELFGHEKGAFTGAHRQQVGHLEMADGGTLFLDEIGDLPPATQVKLLRVLQERRIQRVGGRREVELDVRLIAATHRDLAKMIADGAFRADLFYRLNVFPITIPPLRERADDIPLLVETFVRRLNRQLDRRVESVAPDALRLLRAYSWPGNVRELLNVIERAMILAPGQRLTRDLLPASIIAEAEALASAGSRPTTAGRGMPAQPLNTKLPASADGVPTFDPRRGEDVGALDGEARDEARDEEGDAWVNAALADGSGLQHAVDELKRRMIRAALRQHEGNKSRVAEALGVGRRYLYTLMEKLGLDSEEL